MPVGGAVAPNRSAVSSGPHSRTSTRALVLHGALQFFGKFFNSPFVRAGTKIQAVQGKQKASAHVAIAACFSLTQ